MIYFVVLFIGFFLLAFILRMYRSAFHALAENSVALVNQLIADVDEDTKIKHIQITTNKVLLDFGKVFLVVAFAVFVASIPMIVYCLLQNVVYEALDFSSFYAILAISLGATFAFIIPFSKKKKSDYSELSQLLHRMALDNYYVANKLFQREKKKIRKKKLSTRDDFIIVSGLARAGTTSLMNDLAKIDAFVSLSYANMPFLMCPNIWAKFYKPKSKEEKERSHKDGIKIGLNSNEALEEYFFKVKANDMYIRESSLEVYSITDEDYADYLAYQSIVKHDDEKIYLAKNNNFMLRYKSLRAYNDAFIMVIMYRDPLTHASSLLEKHREYQKLQAEDPFVLEYMNWLGHHEFGLNQKQFKLQSSQENTYDKNTLDFWLASWVNYYRYVLTIQDHNTILINYESYCKHPAAVVKNIVEKLAIDARIADYLPFHNKRKAHEQYTDALYEDARNIYAALNQRSLQV